MPQSFRYYDAILSIARDHVSDKARQAFVDQCLLSYWVHRSNDTMLNFRKNFILGEDDKNVARKEALNKIKGLEIDHTKIEAAK